MFQRTARDQPLSLMPHTEGRVMTSLTNTATG